MAKQSFFVLAACLLLAQQDQSAAQYNTQGIPPPPGTNPSPAKMTFFVCTEQLCLRQQKTLSVPVTVE